METVATNQTSETVTFNNLCELFSTETPDGKTITMCRTDHETFIKDPTNANFVWIEKAANQILKVGKYLISGHYGEKNTPIYCAKDPVYKT
jgi:hypothetical protein